MDVEALVRLLRAFVLAATLLCAVQSHLSAEEKGRELFPAIDAAKSPQSLTLVDAIRGAAGGFRPTSPEDVEEARRNLREAANRLSQFLSNKGERGDRWRAYLRCNDLRDQLERSPPDVEVLESVLARFSAGHCGLERPPCCEVRKALRVYVDRRRDAQEEDLAEQYSVRLDALLQCVEDEQLDEATRREALGRELIWFVAHGQAVPLTRAVQHEYSGPNLIASVSADFVNRAVARPISETLPFQQMQGRTAIRGSAHVQGGVLVRLVDSDYQAAADVVLLGNMDATMTGSRGPVDVFARGNADIVASKRLLLGPTGLSAYGATSEVALATRLAGASTRFRLPLVDRAVSRLALRVAQREKAAADSQAEQEAQQLINERFEQEVNKLAGELQRAYFEAYRNPLLRRDAFPKHFALQSTHKELRLSLLQAAANQLGAPREGSASLPSGDVAVRLHETFVENLAETLLAGRTMTESEIRDELERLTGGATDADPGETAGDDEVAVTFPDRRPLSVRLGDGVVAVTLRGDRYISGSRAYPPMNVSVRYQLRRVGDGYLAEMVGEPEITPPRFVNQDGPNRYSGREAALRRLLVNRLEKHLQQHFEAESLILPQPFGDVSELLVRQLDARDGWFTAALALGPRPPGRPQGYVATALPTSR